MMPRYHFNRMEAATIMTPADTKTRGLKGLNSIKTIQGNKNKPKVWLIKSELVVYSEMIFFSPVKWARAVFIRILNPKMIITIKRKKRNWFNPVLVTRMYL